MVKFRGPHYKELSVSMDDLAIASITWGFTLGFGWLTTWESIRQTRMARTPWKSVYVYMIWGEIIVCLAFSIMCWMHLHGDIPGNLAYYFSILTLWSLQVQFLLQIIINRINVIIPDRRKGARIKWSVAVVICAINVSVYCIWIPARLQINETFHLVNEIWDRCEKVIYLIIDATLNWYFIRQVKRRLVNQGSKKYDKLVQFNVRIIMLSLSMDCLIIGTMSLKNSFVYMQFHPLAYIVKLMIELSMASLIRKIAREKNDMGPSNSHSRSYELSTAPAAGSTMRSGIRRSTMVPEHVQHTGPGVMVHKQVIVESATKEETDSQLSRDGKDNDSNNESREDVTPLKDTWVNNAYHAQIEGGG